MAGKILVIYMNRPDILQIIESKHSPVIIATYKTQRKNQEWAETFPITSAYFTLRTYKCPKEKGQDCGKQCLQTHSSW